MKDSRPAFWWLLAVVLAAYGMTLKAPVVHDDVVYLQGNAILGLPWGAFWRGLLGRGYFALSGEATYQPLVTLLHYFTWRQPVVYRLVGLLFHALNSFLLYLLIRRQGVRPQAALMAALLFVLFPASTETVDIAAFKGHVLGVTATLACLLCWDEVLKAGGGARRAGAACVMIFAVGLCCKETVLLVPLLMEPYRRLRGRGIFPRAAGQTFAGVIIVAAAYGVWRFAALAPVALPLRRWMDPLGFLGWYARMLVWPHPLCLQRRLEAGWGYRAVGAGFLLTGWWVRGRRTLLLGWLWMLVALLPYLRLVPFASVNPVADRYLYGAAAGLCLFLADLLEGPSSRWALYALLLVWGALTIRRNGLYRDEGALCEQTAACSPSSAEAQIMLGDYELRQGLNIEAKERFRSACELDPASAVAWSNLGVADYMLADYDSSIADFRKAIAASDIALLHNHLGNALAAKGFYAQAAVEYDAAARLSPGWEDPVRNGETARRLLKSGRTRAK